MKPPQLARLLAVPLLALLTAPATAGAQFSPDDGSPYPAGESPFAAAVADFDGDGRADVATADEGSDDVAILLRQPGGGYAPEAGSPIAAGDGPTSIAAADFDGDGRPDLAVSNFGSGDVTILLRQPGGGFAQEDGSPIATGAQASSVAVADFNADGRPDLAVTNQNALNVTILLRQPGGGFAEEAGSPVAVGTYPHEVAIADFDQINGPDLAVTNQSSNDVTILLRQPGGGFAEEAGSPIAVGTTPLGIAAADFDADGDPDLAVANSGSNSISVLRRMPGGFTADPSRAIGASPYGLVAADFEGDAHPDLAVANGDSIDILRGDDFAAGSTIADLGGPLRIATGDLDGDGRADLVAPGHANNTVSTLLNASSPAPTGKKPRNVQPPSIKPAFLPRRYVCDEGLWEDLGPNPTYTYEWYSISSFGTRKLVGTAYQYTVPEAFMDFAHYCVVTVTNEYGSTSAVSPWTVLNTPPEAPPTITGPVYGNVAVRGIDVFQTVQPTSGAQMYGFPSGGFPLIGGAGTPTNLLASGVFGGPRQRVAYSGVPLDRDKPATAIVYVNMTAAAAASPNTPLVVTLHWLVDGQRFGSISQEIKNPPVSALPGISAAERDDARFGVQLQVPSFALAVASLGSRLDLEAEVGFPMAELLKGRRECTTTCAADNRFRLDDVPAAKLPALTVVGVKMFGRNQTAADIADANSVMQKARQLFPGGESLLIPTVAALDVGDETSYTVTDDECDDIDSVDTRSCRQYYLNARLESWRADDPVAKGLGSYQATIGVHEYRTGSGSNGFEPGWTDAGVDLGNWNPKYGASPLFTANDGSAGRPLTAAAHEWGHVLSAPHADTTCGGNSNGEVGEMWPPDNRGRLQGVKFDGTAPAGALGRIDPVVDTAPTPLYELMSYCAPESGAWLSARNWNRAFQVLQNLDAKMKAPAAGAAQAGQGFAVGVVAASGGRIVRYVAPDGNDRIPAAEPGSPVRLRALDASGRVVQEVGVHVSSIGEGGSFAGPVPAAAAAVELVRDGAVVDRLTRSAAPTVRLRSARPGGVRWVASDPDGDALHAGVEYSPDGGRTWRTVFDGPSTGRATLPAGLLAGSDDARLRVTVSDGFTEARAESGRLRVAGARPLVRIVAPRTAVATQPVALAARALDDRQRPIRGRALTWYARARRLGTGERLSVRLPAGRTTLRLVAVDARGKRSVARTAVRVR
jgi:hypothetical protein